MTTDLNPLDHYQVAVEFLVSEESLACAKRADEAHADVLGYVYFAPWYARWFRNSRFLKLQRTHEAIGNEVYRRHYHHGGIIERGGGLWIGPREEVNRLRWGR